MVGTWWRCIETSRARGGHKKEVHGLNVKMIGDHPYLYNFSTFGGHVEASDGLHWIITLNSIEGLMILEVLGGKMIASNLTSVS